MILHANLLVTFPQKLSLSPIRQMKKTKTFQNHRSSSARIFSQLTATWMFMTTTWMSMTKPWMLSLIAVVGFGAAVRLLVAGLAKLQLLELEQHMLRP